MTSSEIAFRVRYNEVDRMGYAHHGNYAAYFEMGRTELMREHGLNYKEMEDKGILLPLSDFKVKYFQPAFYDDELRLVTILEKFTGVRLVFCYRLYNKKNLLLSEGSTSLAFVSASTGKPVRPSEEILEKLRICMA
ncbi:MAG: acyl-CoA thioesterase [Bacteroidales bacterium]|nr:acyl-CoA thioesterase [Bacteroidales bacterium]